MATGRIFDRPGHPPLHGPPAPGTVLRPTLLSRVAFVLTAEFLWLAALGMTDNGIVIALAVLLAPLVGYRVFRLAQIDVGVDLVRVHGLLRTKTITRDELLDVAAASLTWQSARGRKRTWSLWPYLNFSVLLSSVGDRNEEVLAAMSRLVTDWHPPAS